MTSCKKKKKKETLCDLLSLTRLTAHCPYLEIPAESSNSMLCCTITEEGFHSSGPLLQPTPCGPNRRLYMLKVQPAGGSLMPQKTGEWVIRRMDDIEMCAGLSRLQCKSSKCKKFELHTSGHACTINMATAGYLEVKLSKLGNWDTRYDVC